MFGRRRTVLNKERALRQKFGIYASVLHTVHLRARASLNVEKGAPTEKDVFDASTVFVHLVSMLLTSSYLFHLKHNVSVVDTSSGFIPSGS